MGWSRRLREGQRTTAFDLDGCGFVHTFRRSGESMRAGGMIFDAHDRAHFEREGWVIARGVVPPENIRAAIDAICRFHAIDLHDPSTWYRVPPEAWDIVPVHHAQAFWNNRS